MSQSTSEKKIIKHSVQALIQALLKFLFTFLDFCKVQNWFTKCLSKVKKDDYRNVTVQRGRDKATFYCSVKNLKKKKEKKSPIFIMTC